MPSPFPGMNPWLEAPAIWPDFHGTLLVRIRAILNRSLPPGFFVSWDRHVRVEAHDDPVSGPLGRPDVFVSEQAPHDDSRTENAVIEAPTVVLLPTPEAYGRPFLRIVDVRGHRVVTVIEMLSPANKTLGRDRDTYMEKRQEFLRSRTSLVELDLLRAGARPPVLGLVPPADYLVLVSDARDFPRAGLWPIHLREPLPTIPVPLSPDVSPIHLPLQECLHTVYDEAGYVREIDYTQPPVPPLSEEDAAWAQEVLRHPRDQGQSL